MEDIIFSAKQVQGKKALFGKGRFALQNVDFELPSGYIMGIIGENGAGKTTFFRYIMEEKKHYRGKLLSGRNRYRGRSCVVDEPDRICL